MSGTGTLGPIDPQINGIPARAIRRAFETLEERLAAEGELRTLHHLLVFDVRLEKLESV
jgi:hypothetical protein